MRNKTEKKRLLILILAVALIVGVFLFVMMQQEQNKIRGTDLISPVGLLSGSDGMLYVVDSGLNAVLWYDGERAENVAGYTMPMENAQPAGGFLDAEAGLALFDTPIAMAEWNGGMVVSDRENHMLRFLKDEKISTLAGTKKAGSQNGKLEDATFNKPWGLAVGDDGSLYVADSGNGKIRRITPDGKKVEHFISGLDTPTGLCWANGALYIADRGKNKILCWKNQTMTTVAGSGAAGNADGAAMQAKFNEPTAVLAVGDCLYIADTGNMTIRKLKDGQVTTYMKRSDGDTENPWPGKPTGLAWHNGKIYAADGFAGAVYEVKHTK